MSAKQKFYRDNIFFILDELDFARYLENVAPRMIIDPATFEKNDQLFRHVYYFLFERFNKEQAKGRFRGVYSTHDKRQEAEFRQITIKLLEDIGNKYPAANFGNILAIYFQRLYGEPYLELTYRLALFVFKKAVRQAEKNYENVDQWIESLDQIDGETETDKLLNYIQELNTFDQQLSYFEGRVEKRYELLKSQDGQLKNELAQLEKYRSPEFLAKINEKQTKDLSEINDYLRDILETIEMKIKASYYRVIRPNNSDPSHNSDSLLEQMKQYNLFVKFFKNHKNDMIKALKEAINYNKALQSFKSTLVQAKEEITRREEAIIRKRSEISEMPKVKELRDQILDYYKPIFNVSLNFANYGLPKELTEYDFSKWPPINDENDTENK